MLVNEAWLLRWRFDFHTRPPRMGMWSQQGPMANQAWHQNKEGLDRASIEGKNLRTKEVKQLVSCRGQDFRNFQQIAGHLMSTGTTQFLGMCIMMRDKRVEVFKDGRCTVIDLTEREKTKNLATYGK